MQKLWAFLGVETDASLEKAILEEMSSNPDEEWQASRNRRSRLLPAQRTGRQLDASVQRAGQICFQKRHRQDAGQVGIRKEHGLVIRKQ